MRLAFTVTQQRISLPVQKFEKNKNFDAVESLAEKTDYNWMGLNDNLIKFTTKK